MANGKVIVFREVRNASCRPSIQAPALSRAALIGTAGIEKSRCRPTCQPADSSSAADPESFETWLSVG